MSSSGTVDGDERLRLFLGFRLPDAAGDAVAAWQRAELAVERVRIVPLENLHVTIAFLGSRPAGETEAIAGALRAAVHGVAEPVLTPARYRETRSVGMLVLDDQEGRATRIAEDAHGRLEQPRASTSPSGGSGFRTSRSSAFASDRGSSPRSPISGR